MVVGYPMICLQYKCDYTSKTLKSTRRCDCSIIDFTKQQHKSFFKNGFYVSYVSWFLCIIESPPFVLRLLAIQWVKSVLYFLAIEKAWEIF